MHRFFLVALVAVLVSCGAGAPDTQTPPASKEILRLLFSLRDVPLRSDPSCATAGTSTSDVDIGDYVSGWLAELKQGPGSNWIEASAKAEQRGWRCIVMFRHVDGEDRWGWGVSFLVRESDRKPVPGSLRCLGAG